MRHSISVISLALVCATAGFTQVTLNPVPSRIVGHPNAEQLAVTSSNPNLVEGRELFGPVGIALDTSVTPPMVYVSDAGNNRILAWKSATAFRNGDFADLVIGQRDKFTTAAQGPTIGLQTGVFNPTGLTVRNGDLWVVDSGNNRLLRYPKPFQQSDQFPDIVIGQTNLNGRNPNFNGTIDARGIHLNSNVGFFPGSIVFDTAGNLWFTDAGNRRVLRYRAADITAKVNGPAADLEIGQLDFLSAQPALRTDDAGARLRTNQFAVPNSVAFDSAGRLYVSDADKDSPGSLSRVLVFSPPFTSGMSASRIMGVLLAPPAGQTISQAQADRTLIVNPGGIFFLPGTQGMGVLDSFSNRILIFDPYDQWPDQNTQFSPQAKAAVGQQGSFTLRSKNSGNPRPSESTLLNPVAATFVNNELYISDSGNNRVIVMPFQNGSFGPATRTLGQDRFDTNSINLIEGREFQFVISTSAGTLADAGIAIDSTGDVPRLYVSDPYNHRVLGFRDARKVAAGVKADIQIGQPDMQTALCNYPSGTADQPTQSSLCGPMGIAVDANGNLYVADEGNGRVLRFPAPFSHPGQQQADLVLGQRDFTSKITDPSPRTMSAPYGLAFAGNNGLLVSDQVHNRVLFFPFSGNGTFAAGTDNGKSATKVFGQPDFSTVARGFDDAGLSGPHHIAADTDARFYVTDPGNNRVLIFDQILNNPNAGAHAAYTLIGPRNPEGIFVSQKTGEIWVTDTNGGRALRYPRFDSLVITGSSNPTAISAAGATLAVAQDQFGDLFVADSTNRIGIYFPGLAAVNGASFLLNRSLAPGMISSVFPLNATTNQFGKDTSNFNDLPNPLPLPKTLADIQVLFNGQPVPLYYVSPGQINFLVPMSAPTTGSADLTVVRPSTLQILAAGPVQMNSASPGVFPFGPPGKLVQAAVLNEDNTINSPTNPAARGSIIQIFATGQGFVPGAPPDGEVVSGQINTPNKPRVSIGLVGFVDDPAFTGEEGDHTPFSGLAPGLVGVWQINVKIPQKVPPGGQVPILILMNSIPNTDSQSGFVMTVAVK
jgi:uncharacterized protein (TIGR03437 family)